MAEYIEREAAAQILRKEAASHYPTPFHVGLFAAARVIDAIPAADVRPVVRGRWIKCVGENGVTSACRCRLCGFEDNRFSVFNYCPNCGADMREES